ncbi:MAG: hypothetical protein IJW37_08360 [Lachnospiraceae bacterium]|nr:hypothetical protein [Lachnospiraceae bacterium]
MKKIERKKISFVVFVMAVFFAGVALVAFSSYVWMLAIAGVVLLAASCFFIWDRGEEKEQTPSEKTSEILLADRMAELMRGNEKAEKGVYIAVKKQHEAMEEGMSMLEARLNELVKAQESAMKTLVLYNKENARQIALSERDQIEHLCKELQDGFTTLKAQLQDKDFIEEISSPVVAVTKQTGNRIYEELHESNEAILSELGNTADSVEEMKALLSELVHSNVDEKFGNLVSELPRVPLEALISEEELEEDEPEEIVEFEPDLMSEEAEPEVEGAVAEPEDAFAASGVDLSDPNKTLSADDIAALFASMGGASEPEPEPEVEEEPMAEIEEPAPIEEPEPVSEQTTEDAFAASGVDLSDPNKTLSADDIAALFASMGN